MNRHRVQTGKGLLVLVWVCAALLMSAALAEAARVKLVFAGRDPLDTPGGQAWKAAIEAYMKANPDVEIEYVLPEAGGPQYLEKLLILGAGVGFPDIMHLYNVWMPDLAVRNVFDPMPADLLNRLRRELHPESLVGAEYQGKQLGVPTQFQVSGLMYNKRLLAEAGVAEVPRTYDELTQLAKRLVGSKPEGQRPVGMAVNSGGWGWTGNWYALTVAYGASYADTGGELILDTPVGRTVLEAIVQWFARDRWASKDRDAFMRGNGYFGLGYPWWKQQLSQVLGADFMQQIGVARMPAGPARIGAYMYGWGLYVSRSSQNRAEAWKFLEWLATRPEFQGLTAIGAYQAAVGSLPTHRRDLQAGIFAREAPYYEPFIENLAYAVTEAKLPMGEQRQAILAGEIEAAIALKKSPPQALADAARQIQALLASQKAPAAQQGKP